MSIVLLHGFAGDPAAWDDVVASWALAVAPRAIALPGHGGGAVQPTWEQNLDAVARAVGDCDVVVGYSLGARVALGLVVAGAAPRAVLIGVNPGIDDAERPARRASDAAWAAVLRDEGVASFDTRWTAQPLFASQSRVAPERRAARRDRRLALSAEELARSLETMGLAEMPDYRPHLAAHRDRLALITGADDARFTAIARTLPAASFEEIAGSGHDPTLEAPHELALAIARGVARLR